MKRIIVTLALLISTTVFAETPSWALIERKEDITKPLVSLENKIQKLYDSFDVYVGGTYNEAKDAGYPILAVKYSKYTLEFAREGWFDAPKNNYWKLKVKKPFGIDRVNVEVQQKKNEYTVKGFMQLF
tara:strand:- start:317 stop:700 length:384 start_codon:yes stop_codon:yes gene_type:complete